MTEYDAHASDLEIASDTTLSGSMRKPLPLTDAAVQLFHALRMVAVLPLGKTVEPECTSQARSEDDPSQPPLELRLAIRVSVQFVPGR